MLGSQQTRDIDTMLEQCWSTVYDGCPTLIQHCVDVLCLMGLCFLLGIIS